MEGMEGKELKLLSSLGRSDGELSKVRLLAPYSKTQKQKN